MEEFQYHQAKFLSKVLLIVPRKAKVFCINLSVVKSILQKEKGLWDTANTLAGLH